MKCENYELFNYAIYFVLGLIGMFPFIGKFITKCESENTIKHIFINGG